MKRLALAVLLCACVLSVVAVGDQPQHESGLVAHYYRDSECWEGRWPESVSKPLDDPEAWTFTHYAYTRVEPLVNHLFIRRGWFSVRWQGSLDTSPGPKANLEATYKFSLWVDDGCRLIVDGEKIIDDWRACSEDAEDAVRSATVKLAPGKHKITIEYFQGQSLRKNDHDPVKLYWECEERGIPHQIVPASHLSHTQDDLAAPAGRLD